MWYQDGEGVWHKIGQGRCVDGSCEACRARKEEMGFVNDRKAKSRVRKSRRVKRERHGALES